MALSGIVLEPLSRDNYLDWSTLVKNYLAGQGLWDDIVANDYEANNDISDCASKTKKTKKKKDILDRKLKNSQALHVIQLSCGNPALAYVRHFQTAKETWNTLRVSFGIGDFGAYPAVNIKQVLLTNLENEDASQLHRAVQKGLWNLAKELINRNERLLVMKDNMGNTALALAAELTDDRKIAEYMVGGESGRNLLSQSNHKGEMPVTLASAKGHREMTRYLFYETPWSVLLDTVTPLKLDPLSCSSSPVSRSV